MSSSVLRGTRFPLWSECTPQIAVTYLSCGRTRCNLRFASSRSRGEVIFSGIQPTGVPHLGNYLGALRQWARTQNDATLPTQLLFSIVDQHAITTTRNAEQLRKWKRETLATLLASGLDPQRSVLFYQSTVGIVDYLAETTY